MDENSGQVKANPGKFPKSVTAIDIITCRKATKDTPELTVVKKRLTDAQPTQRGD
jgi:hypothetical protein